MYATTDGTVHTYACFTTFIKSMTSDVYMNIYYVVCIHYLLTLHVQVMFRDHHVRKTSIDTHVIYSYTYDCVYIINVCKKLVYTIYPCI